MFFGGAGIPRAIEACRRKVHPYRIKSDAAAAVTLAGLLADWLLRRGRRDGKDGGIFYGDRITVTIDGGEAETCDRLVILATTLNRLILGSRPFWGGGGDLRFTSIGYPPERMLRYAWRLLYGGEDRAVPTQSYRSHGARRVALGMTCPFTIDGEIFGPTPGKEVVLTAADEARFARL
jgi:hypothetical protein